MNDKVTQPGPDQEQGLTVSRIQAWNPLALEFAAAQPFCLHHLQLSGAGNHHLRIRHEVELVIEPFVGNGIEDHLHDVEACHMLVV